VHSIHDSTQILSKKGPVAVTKFTYDDATSLTVQIRQEKGWIQMEVTKAKGL